MLAALLLAGAWFAAFLFAHVALFHARAVGKRFQALTRLFGTAAAGAALSAWGASAMGLAGPLPGGMVAALTLVATCCLFVLYMPFYYTVATSQSVATLVDVEQAPGQRLPLDRLVAERASEAMLRARLDSMVANGNLASAEGLYRITPKGRRVARAFAALKALWRLGPGG